MSETPTVPTMHVPTQNELNRLVEQQFKNSYEANPDLYFHAWENQGVHKDALKDQAGKIELDRDDVIDDALWATQEATQPEMRPEVMMNERDIIAFTLPAGRNLIYERRLANLQN